VACLRELFEEAGLLIACRENGSPSIWRSRDGDEDGGASKSLNEGSLTFLEMLRHEDLALDARGLAYLAHWVTPVGSPRRYDTRFSSCSRRAIKVPRTTTLKRSRTTGCAP